MCTPCKPKGEKEVTIFAAEKEAGGNGKMELRASAIGLAARVGEEAEPSSRFGPGCSAINSAISEPTYWRSIKVEKGLRCQGLSRPLSENWRR